MKNVYDVLKERGFIKQTIYDEDLYKMLGEEKVKFYVGFDPTADSLHIGHYIPVMAMAWMQKYGHTPIALFGGGTGMIGDPSGRSDMRTMMTRETVDHNVECFKKQMSRFINFEGENAAIIANNADWLLKLNYVDFLRDIGAYFSVNKMLTAECYKQRMEKGLTFLEFNYMLMQGYDFLKLSDIYDCKLELGGDDQWSNMLAGVDLIRRKKQQDAFCMTCTLLLTSDGKKMGKTQKGALWLDENKCSVYDFYQYFRSVEDAKVEECMKLLTFMDLEEIEELCKYKDERINEAKKRPCLRSNQTGSRRRKGKSSRKAGSCRVRRKRGRYAHGRNKRKRRHSYCRRYVYGGRCRKQERSPQTYRRRRSKNRRSQSFRFSRNRKRLHKREFFRASQGQKGSRKRKTELIDSYSSIKEGVFTLEIKRSEFIAYSFPVESEDDAAEKLAAVRKKHYDARHVCYAFVADEDGMIARFSDDGESSGTAGSLF